MFLSVCCLSIQLSTYRSILHPSVLLSVHCLKALYHYSQLKSSPPPNTTKNPKMVRKMTAFPVITRPQAPHWICWRKKIHPESVQNKSIVLCFSQGSPGTMHISQEKCILNILTIDVVRRHIYTNKYS